MTDDNDWWAPTSYDLLWWKIWNSYYLREISLQLLSCFFNGCVVAVKLNSHSFEKMWFLLLQQHYPFIDILSCLWLSLVKFSFSFSCEILSFSCDSISNLDVTGAHMNLCCGDYHHSEQAWQYVFSSFSN